MIYIGAATSGAHYNPAVTLALMVTKKHGCMDTIWYILAQFIGGFLGGFMVWAVSVNATNFLYSKTYPSFNTNDANPIMKACFAEFIATYFLVFMVFATAVDQRAPRSVYGIAIGGTVGMSALGLGGISGGALNPCRWIGPWIVGMWGNTDNQAAERSAWAFLPYLIFACLGGMVAGITYNCMFLPKDN